MISSYVSDTEAAVEYIAANLWETVRGDRGDWAWCKNNDPRHALHIRSIARAAVLNAQESPRLAALDLSFKHALLGLK